MTTRWTDCDRCGRFQWTEGFGNALAERQPAASALPVLSARTRNAAEQNRTITLDVGDLSGTLNEYDPPVAEKARKLIEAFAARSRPGTSAWLSLDLDYPLIGAVARQEMIFFANYLHSAGLIATPTYPQGLGGKEDETIRTELTFAGWQFLEPLRKTQLIPGRIFVAMSFDDDLDDAYEHGIEAAIRDAGCEPRMLKGMVHSEDISDKILAEIAQAEFVIADMTRGSHGAYFEAGYGMALGRRVVFTCREDYWHAIHFDTAQYPYIKWNTPPDLREKLRDWLLALRGQAS